MTTSLIAEVEAVVLRAGTLENDGDLDGSCETVLVRIHDENGRVGVGEADAPAAAVRELVLMDDVHAWSRGLRGMLLGRDPFEIGSLHADLRQGTIYHARRGLGIHALSAVDVALHDLVGKQLGRPVYQLLGGARRDAVTPYATIYAGAVAGRTIGQMMDDIAARFERALELGFRAVKMEVLFEDLVGDRELVVCIREGRRLLGDGITMMLDFGYRWSDWRDALWTLRRVEDCDIFFAEAALRHDDVVGHAKLADRVETRVCGAEFAATLDECREWLERGRRRCAAAGRQPLRRADRDPENRRSRGAPRGARHPALLEDGGHGGRVAPLPGSDAQRAVGRDVPPGALRLRPSARAHGSGAGDRGRPHRASDGARPRDRGRRGGRRALPHRRVEQRLSTPRRVDRGERPAAE